MNLLTQREGTERALSAPQPTNISTLISNAVNRVASLVKLTGETAYFLGHRAEEIGPPKAQGSIENPGPSEMLLGLHELLSMVERNVVHIQQRVG